MTVDQMGHDDICEWIANRLPRMGYRHAYANMTSATCGEQPDALGLSLEGDSILIEVKTSKSDFKADSKKPWRRDPKQGIGDQRVYLAPEGLLEVGEIPYGWQLWEIYGVNQPRLRIKKGREKRRVKDGAFSRIRIFDHHMDSEELRYFTQKNKNYHKELMWMLKLIDRATQAGVDMTQFSNNYR